MNIDVKKILKSPMVDIWASMLEAGIIFILKMESGETKSLKDIVYSFLDVQYKSLLSDLVLSGLAFVVTIFLVFYVTTRSIKWFSMLSYILLVGSSLHLTISLLNPNIEEYFCYMLMLSSLGFLLALYYSMESENGMRHPFLDITEAIRDHPIDFMFILCASVVKAFIFVWFFSGKKHGGLGSIKDATFVFFEVAAMSSLMYNMRAGVVLLMTVNKNRDIRSYIKLIIRRVRLIGTVCLAGILRLIIFAIYFPWKSANIFGLVRPPKGKYTIRHNELSVFYSVLNDVSIFEGRRLAERALEDEKLYGRLIEFRSIPGMFIPCCFSLVYILSSSVGRYAQYIPQQFICLYFVLLYFMFLEFLYSIVTLKSIINGQRNEIIP